MKRERRSKRQSNRDLKKKKINNQIMVNHLELIKAVQLNIVIRI